MLYSKIMKKNLLIAVILGVALGALPVFVEADSQPKLYYAGWLPYWKKASGVQETALHLEKLNEISPFSYEVKSNGTLVDKLKIATDKFWPAWFSAVRDSKTKILPTIAWFDGKGIHALLSNSKKRISHEDAITKLVKSNNFDGIDIDYESKLAETKDYFSLFIKGLAIRLHPLGKKLSCTIESRAPIESLLAKGVPKEEIKRANDYDVLNKYCDEVRLMAYDQGIVDPFLNKEKGTGQFYVPVADPAWVEKLLKETVKTISRSKVMLGIPTYGYEYEISQSGTSTTYSRLRSLTHTQAILLAANLGQVPQRNSAGELSFVYATSTPLNKNLASSIETVVSSAIPGSSTRLVWFSDAKAIADKIKLAQKYKLRGVVFFKIDGEADPAMWKEIK